MEILSESTVKMSCSRQHVFLIINFFNRFALNTGHYTQVVWADTYKVGCGFTAYKASNGWYDKYYVCNYGPTGNRRGGSMYKTGSACSKCSGACDNGLCV